MSLTARVLPPALLLLLVAAPPAAAAGDWSVAPFGGGRPSFYAEGAPGAVLQDTVSVTNRGGQPVTVRLSATGARVVFARSEVRVPARTRADVPFTVTVPDADRSAGIVVCGPDGRSSSVTLHLRAEVPQLAALTVEQVKVTGAGISYEIVNRGTTTLEPRLAVRADGLFGPLLNRPARALPVELSPGERVKLTEPWPDRPSLDTAEVRLTVTAGGGARDTARASARFVPWGSVAGGAGAVAGAAFFVVRRRRRRTDDVAEPPGGGAELTGAVK
ncbi:hypothetical protein [Streptomyces cupreus]|uniref:DUF916 domain-containing protein n=1 Tax=Streptomyces cupreus TaxID=2759956 RepID=A0A7X1JCI2_9ACTN|nr:hypothetical protein [Streptomyces cupreus]MBC2908190.1 hypothetical protein [Streptomyces cupreus]